MKISEIGRHPEPVPAASQLAILPFLAGVEGFLRGPHPHLDIRLTVHRTLNREGQQFLQQVCSYVGSEDQHVRTGAGQLFPVNYGIMGAAFEKLQIMHTPHYASEEDLVAKLRESYRQQGRDLEKIQKDRRSWLAVPFLGPGGEPVLILYGDSFKVNFFADVSRVQKVVDMAWGFCRLIDQLEERPIPILRNYPFESGEKVMGDPTVYIVQKPIDDIEVPKFARLRSFNYETSVI